MQRPLAAAAGSLSPRSAVTGRLVVRAKVVEAEVEATTGEDGCAHPKSLSMTLRLSGWAGGRATATSGRDAWRSGVVDWVGAPNPGGRAGGKGKLSVSPISGTSRPGGSGRLPAGGIGDARGKASSRGSGKGAVGSRLATCCGAVGAAEFSWAARLASMAMSAKGFEMACVAVGAGVHQVKTVPGSTGPSPCRAQTLTAPAKAKAAPKGTIFGRTR